MRDGVHYGLLTMFALVLLRLSIGWHFYSEGTHHVTDAGWSSEGFLKAAKGPFADKYHAVLPDFHGWEKALYADSEKDPVATGTRTSATISKRIFTTSSADTSSLKSNWTQPNKPSGAGRSS